MVRKASSHLVKEIVPAAQCVGECLERSDGCIRSGFEPLDPRIEYFGQVYVESLVRPERREHFGLQARARDRLVACEIVGGVVRGANCSEPEFREKAMGAEFAGCEALVSLLPNSRRRGFVEQFINFEITLQLEM